MNATPVPVRTVSDILPAYRDTPVAELLRWQNLGEPMPAAVMTGPRLLVACCLEPQAALKLPDGFAITLRTAAASLKRDPFKVSWAIGVAGVEAVVLVGHAGCGMVGLRQRREPFIAQLIESAGWERPAAEQHFDHWSDLFEVEDPAEFVAAEAARLRRRYPRMLIAPLLQASDGKLMQVEAPDAPAV